MNYNDCSDDMTQLKKSLEWLKEVDTALQSFLKDLDAAFQNFFRRVKRGGKPGYPRFKNKRNYWKSYKEQMHHGASFGGSWSTRRRGMSGKQLR